MNNDVDVTQLACFEHVSEVIGKRRAIIELRKAIKSPSFVLNHKDLCGAFMWRSTVRGNIFWRNIYLAKCPQAFK